jgi:aspartyl/glutamyl-tRNA(Asn/Gln) amidotransferase C subunit
MDLYEFLGYTGFMNKEDIQKLADLSRLTLTENEIIGYNKDFEGILAYINTLSAIDVHKNIVAAQAANTNYVRDDEQSYSSGEFSEDILNQAPSRKEYFIKVQKIL